MTKTNSATNAELHEKRLEGIQKRKDSEESAGSVVNVFDARVFQKNAELVISKLVGYLEDTTVRGLALTKPADLLALAREFMLVEQDCRAERVEQKLDAIVDLYIKTGIQVHSPGYMGRQFSGVIPLAGLCDLISSIVNQPSSFYEAAQLPNIAERIMADELNNFIGWDRAKFAMVTTSGGSLANLTALLAARNEKFPRIWSEGIASLPGQGLPAIAVGETAHYSICRAAGILGIGEDQIVRLPVNRKQQICVNQVGPVLDAAFARGLNLFCLVAAAGTTSVGAFDPLEQLSLLCQERGLWLHVDGAHGASLLLSDALRHKLKGIEHADSFTWDAHKMMFVPAMCTLLFYKNKEMSYGAFRQNASYVFENEPDIYTAFDSAEKNLECTKRPMIMSLWVPWALYGKSMFADKIEYLCRLTHSAFRMLESEPDFETLHEPEANILCFRYHPANLAGTAEPADFQVAIRNRIKEQGRFFISKVDLDGSGALRVVFMNHIIKLSHFRMLLQEIRATGQELLLGTMRND